MATTDPFIALTGIETVTTLGFSSSDTHIEALAGGGFVVAWSTWDVDGSDRTVMARVYDAAFQPQGDAFVVNTLVMRDQDDPLIVARDDGGFDIIFASEGYLESGAQTWTEDPGRYVRSFDASGTPQGDATHIPNWGQPVITAIGNGQFFELYGAVYIQNQSFKTDVYGRILDAGYQPTGALFKVNTTALGDDLMHLAVATLDNGNVVTIWSDDGIHVGGTGLYGQIVTPTGQKVGAEFTVNTWADGRQLEQRIEVLDGGNFVVTWKSGYGQDGSDWGQFAQVFAPDGSKLGGEFQVNTTSYGIQYYGTPVALEGGGFVVVYYSSNWETDTESAVVAQLFDGTGQQIGGEHLVASLDMVPDNHFVNHPYATALEGGGFVVAWTTHNMEDEVQMRVYGAMSFGTSAADVIFGTSAGEYIGGRDGDDEIHGLGQNDIIEGDEGADTLYGDGGDDTLRGGAGDDSLDGGNWHDVLEGGAGHDVLSGGFGNDSLVGGSDNDMLSGGGGLDALAGGDGDDTLAGGDQNDTLLGGLGSDLMDGGAGSDLHFVDALDVVTDTGVTGYDRAQITDAAGVWLDLTGWSGVERVNGHTGDDVIDASSQSTAFALTGLGGADHLIGGSGNDAIIGGDGADTLTGGAGNDTLLGGDGADLFDGGAGNDVFYIGEALDMVTDGGAGFDVAVIYAEAGLALNLSAWASVERVTGYTGNDSLDASGLASAIILGGGDGADTLIGGAGDDTIFGGSGADRIGGAAGADVLVGGSGADTLTGGAGDDWMVGGLDGDSFVFSDGFGQDVIADFQNGIDGIVMDAVAGVTKFTNLKVTQVGSDVEISLKAGAADTILLLNTAAADIDAGDFTFV